MWIHDGPYLCETRELNWSLPACSYLLLHKPETNGNRRETKYANRIAKLKILIGNS